MSTLRKSSIDNVVNNATLEQARGIVKAFERKFGRTLYDNIANTEKVGKCSIVTTTSRGIPTSWSNYVIEGYLEKASVEALLEREDWDKNALAKFFSSLDTTWAHTPHGNMVKTKFSSRNYRVKPISISQSTCVLGLNYSINDTEYCEFIKIKRI